MIFESINGRFSEYHSTGISRRGLQRQQLSFQNPASKPRSYYRILDISEIAPDNQSASGYVLRPLSMITNKTLLTTTATRESTTVEGSKVLYSLHQPSEHGNTQQK